MSNTLKIKRANGKVRDVLHVVGLEYKQTGDTVDIEVQVSDSGKNPNLDFYVEDVQLQGGDMAFLMNVSGSTVDVIKVK